MFEYIKGKLTDSSPLHAIVDVHGIGYKLFTPLSHYAKLPSIGTEALFYVSCIIREDSHKLFGFLTKLDRDLFEKLTEVSGIGPKSGLSLLGHLESEDLHLAIANGNVALLCKVPGIGKKTAERLVIEMRDKSKTFLEKSAMPSIKGASSDAASDAINALIHLGYNALDAQKAIKNILQSTTGSPDLPQLITLALRKL